MTHELPMGGASSIAAELVDGSLRVEYRGRFLAGPIIPPRAQRALDIEVLRRLPSQVIAAMVEHTDAGIIPGEGLISRLLPYLVEPEPSDELRTRRLVVISEDEVGGRSEDGLRLPAIAVAIEVDGPGATARRQDLQLTSDR